MATYDLGTATTSTRVAQLLKASYEREQLPPGDTATTAQILGWLHGDIRDDLAQRVRREKKLQREEAALADDEALKGEVTVS